MDQTKSLPNPFFHVKINVNIIYVTKMCTRLSDEDFFFCLLLSILLIPAQKVYHFVNANHISLYHFFVLLLYEAKQIQFPLYLQP